MDNIHLKKSGKLYLQASHSPSCTDFQPVKQHNLLMCECDTLCQVSREKYKYFLVSNSILSICKVPSSFIT